MSVNAKEKRMGHRHVYRLVRETKTKVLNISTSLILVAMSLGGALPTMLTSTAHAAGNTLYVNSGGSNVHNCTDPTKPCRTITKAIENATAGDTISVAAGIYNEDVVVNKDVTINGAGAGVTSIVATGQNTTPLSFSINDATVSGFTIKHVYSTAQQAAWNFNNNGVFFAQGTHGNTLKNSTVTLNRNGVYLNNNTSATLTGNTITDNRTGINLTNDVDGTVISGNTISHNWTVGLVYYSQGYATNFSNVTIANNTFMQNWYEEVEVKNAGASTGTLDLTSDTFNDNGPFWYSTSSDPSQNEPGWPVPHPTELGGTDSMPANDYPTIRIYSSPTVTINYTAVAPDTSSVTFVGSPKYVRINNAGDLDAQLVAPTWVSSVHFFVDGSSSPITGNNVGGASADTDWWRLYTPLTAGEHTITAKVELGGNWYDVADTGTVYALGNPAGDFVSPSSDGQYFRPSDNPLRVTAADTNDSFSDVVFHVNGKDYLVTRSQCDLREAGHRVLCDVDKAVANTSRHTDTWSNLAEGHYTATATIYNQARNHIDATSFGFNVDGTPPKVLNAAIVSPNQSIYKDSVVVTQNVQESNQLNGVSFYITQPRNDGQCDPNQAKVLGPISAHFINHNGDKWYYRTTVDTSSLNGKYCVFSVAEDAAMNHSNSQQAKFTAEFDNVAPIASLSISPLHNGKYVTKTVTVTGNVDPSEQHMKSHWFEIRGPNGYVAYQYNATNATSWSFDWNTRGLEAGSYTIRYVATDTAGNRNDDPNYTNPETKTVIVDNQGPTASFTITPPRYVNDNFHVTATASDNIGLQDVFFDVRDGGPKPIASCLPDSIHKDITGKTASLSCDINTSNLADGQTYTLRVHAGDFAGYGGGQDVPLTFDTSAPATPTITSPANGDYFNTTPIKDAWTAVSEDVNGDPDVSGVDHYQIAYVYDDGHTFGGSTCVGEQINGKTVSGCRDTTATSRNHMPSNGEQGGVTVYVRAVDKAGNAGTWSNPVHYTYDATAPATPLAALADANGTAVTNGYINTKDFTFSLTNSPNDGVDHYQLKYWNNITGSSFNGEVKAWNPTNLSNTGHMSTLGTYTDSFTQGEGTHYFAFSACDAAGNCSAYSAPFQVVYDATAPGQVSNLTDTVSGSNVTWTWDAATDSGSGIKGYILDLVDSNGNRVPGYNLPLTTPNAAASQALNNLPDGTYTFSVVAMDNAGNEGAATPSTVVVDTVAPAIVINGYGKNGNVIQPNVTVDGSTTPTGYTYSWTTNPDVAISNTNALNPTFTVNKYGSYSFTLTVTDASGNVSNAVFSFSYPKPTSPSTTPPTFTNVSTSSSNGSGTSTGTGTPTTLTNNGTGTTTPQVLGASTGKVKGDSTVNVENSSSKQQNKDTGNSQFLGLGWWWLPILLIILAAWWILFGPRRKNEGN